MTFLPNQPFRKQVRYTEDGGDLYDVPILACEAKYLEDQLIERGNLYLRERVEDFLALERKAAGV